MAPATALRAKGAKTKSAMTGSNKNSNNSSKNNGTSSPSMTSSLDNHNAAVAAAAAKLPPPPPPPPATSSSRSPKLSLAVHRYATWLEENQLKKTASWIGVGIAVLVRWAVSMGPYSGQSVPPRFGDYEAQRHWMELTLHRPVREWYSDGSKWWDLDYPPLTAYVSWICGFIGNWINPEWFAWQSSRGFESEDAKLFMRTTVLVAELVVYISGVIVFTNRWFVNKAWTRQHTALVLILLQPGLILIDHGHFQYNGLMLGLVLWAVNSFLKDQDVLGSVFFCMALGFKQMGLYFSPAVFGYLLGKSLRQGFFGCIWKLIKLGLAVVLTLGLMFSPWLQTKEEIVQVATRIFPVFRGLYQDKVANVWCAINVVIKLREMFDIKELVRFSTLATLLSFLPSTLHLIIKPTKRGLLYGLVNASLSFFLLSFQVHEKSILIPALPITLLILDEPAAAALFNTLATFSMYPLLKQEHLMLPYYVLLGVWVWMTTGLFKNGGASSRGPEILAALNLLVIASMHMAETLIPTPVPRYPDLYPVLNALWSATGFILFWIYFNYRQFTLEGQPSTGLRITKANKQA